VWLVLGLTLLAAPNHAAAQMKQALAREQAGDDAGAVALLDRLVAERPELELPRLEAARLRLKRAEDLDLVEIHLEAVRSRAPENPRGQYLWGLLMEERGATVQALHAYELAVLYRPDYPEARQRLGALYLSREDWLRAESHFRVLARAYPEQLQLRFQLATALERQGRLEDTERLLRQLLDEQPESIPVVRRLAEFYDRTERPQLAAKARKALEAAPQKKKMRPLQRSRR
jgi:tetratricopeptide (TPR) repeat protein